MHLQPRTSTWTKRGLYCRPRQPQCAAGRGLPQKCRRHTHPAWAASTPSGRVTSSTAQWCDPFRTTRPGPQVPRQSRGRTRCESGLAQPCVWAGEATLFLRFRAQTPSSRPTAGHLRQTSCRQPCADSRATIWQQATSGLRQDCRWTCLRIGVWGDSVFVALCPRRRSKF
ncbi:hypothetical protein CAOG_009994 [Capsaspora owczarzaki ATCC 30864]|uniref:Uncharacterized protein n=1 Tax=Capsaspora owczarzaki (strain ATCC 30864) TaxID=595528 RepID=A0A0D2VX19_CAPO3|nr:hypothetical protein CAOG_009994 [Capsaspora owczarzaki ATCC 30864]